MKKQVFWQEKDINLLRAVLTRQILVWRGVISPSTMFRIENLRKEAAQYEVEASMIDGGDISDDKAPHWGPATVHRYTMTATL